VFAIELKSESRAVGFCGIVHPGGQAAECKYAYLRRFWGQGIASEAWPVSLATGSKNTAFAE